MRRMYSRIDGWTGISLNLDRALVVVSEEKYCCLEKFKDLNLECVVAPIHCCDTNGTTSNGERGNCESIVTDESVDALACCWENLGACKQYLRPVAVVVVEQRRGISDILTLMS